MLKVFGLALWAVAVAMMIFVASLPLGVEAQFVLATGCLVAMLVMKTLGLRGPLRPVFLALGIFVVLRYLLWRLSSTLPPIDSPFDFVAGYVLVAAECYCVAMLFLSLFTVADPITRPKAPRLSDEDAPTVDVFIPTYDEAIDIVAPTVAAAKRMTYPEGKLNVFLLDDGGTDEKLNSDDPAVATRAINRRQSLQAVCDNLGAHYLAREENVHAKAGNLNNGLANSEGEIIAVFDADHVPAQDFLTETVGFFNRDENLFLVQTPHFFLNPDPIEKNLSAARMPAENEMFYGLVQKGLDKWNAAFFCGSAALLRREALDSVGGFHGSSVTEDAETALELHSHGWSSLYVDKPMIAGLQPETFESFIGQRSRWCRGMVQILLLKNPLFRSGLNMAQRLCYLSSSMFWLFPLSRIIFVLAPMAYIFFGLKIYIANAQEFVAYTLEYMLAALLIQSYVFGRVRWPWTSDLYEYIQSVMLFPAVLGVFINPRKPKFNVTAKGQTLDENHLSSLALPYFVLFGLVAVSMVVLCFRYLNEPDQRGLILVVGVWSALNLFLTGMALGAVSERRERRSVPRVASNLPAQLVIGEQVLPVTIEDMSFGGFRVQMSGAANLPPRGAGVLRVAAGENSGQFLETPFVNLGRRVKSGARSVGLKFYGVNGDRFRIVAKVIFSDINPIYKRRAGKYTTLGVLTGSIYFLTWALNQTSRGLYYFLFKRNEPAVAPIARSTETPAT